MTDALNQTYILYACASGSNKKAMESFTGYLKDKGYSYNLVETKFYEEDPGDKSNTIYVGNQYDIIVTDKK